MPIRPEIVAQKSMTQKRGYNPRGWSPWRDPVTYPRHYTLTCCDCGLTHQYQFRVMKDGSFRLRCRRANGYTQAFRARDIRVGSKKIARKGSTVTITIPSPLRRK